LKVIYIVSVKGFGDALIVLWAIKNSSEECSFRLVTPAYISPLVSHLEMESSSLILSKVLSYPALFNLRSSYFVDVINSMLMLRQEIGHHCSIPNKYFLFDSIGVRELLITPFNSKSYSVAAAKADNIYQNYLTSLAELARVPIISPKKNERFFVEDKKFVAIFFSSRVKSKHLNIDDLHDIRNCCVLSGLIPIFITHTTDILSDALISIFEVKTYENYIELDFILKNVTHVISSDSFPAHYAEYRNMRVYVINNFLNIYYLPYSAYINGFFSVGVDKRRLQSFLLN
jgi:ADP-heptose:LPS heptosyltransferase